MSAYSKMVGSLIGGILGLAVVHFGLPEAWASPEIQSALTVLLSALGTYFAPANTPPAA